MKYIYVNSRINPLLIDVRRDYMKRQWIFSLGEPWLLLTPSRLERLAYRLGLKDQRLQRLIRLIRRHEGNPGAFCRRLRLPPTRYYFRDEYPPTLCPRCDGLHYPHPEDVDEICEECRRREMEAVRHGPGGGELRDREADRIARERLLAATPSLFHEGTLSPNYKYNLHRRLNRDWEAAINRILMGNTYRKVAKEFNCSVGLLHKKVKERYWENN